MATTLLSVSAANPPLTLAPDKIDLWLRVLDAKLPVKRGDPLTRVASPFESTLVLDTDAADAQEVVLALAEAFRPAGVVAGRFEVALSEHADDDAELETPPYFNEAIDLAALETERQRPTVQLELITADTLDAAVLTALERALRATFSEPIGFFVQVLYVSNTARLQLLPVPPDRLPTPEDLRARGFAAAQNAGVELARLEVGAYIGDWDTTVFKHVFKAAG